VAKTTFVKRSFRILSTFTFSKKRTTRASTLFWPPSFSNTLSLEFIKKIL